MDSGFLGITSSSSLTGCNGRECGEHYDSGDHWLRQSGSQREPRQQRQDQHHDRWRKRGHYTRRHYDHRANTGPSQCSAHWRRYVRRGASRQHYLERGHADGRQGFDSEISSSSTPSGFHGRECGEHYDSGDHWLRQSGSQREPRPQRHQHGDHWRDRSHYTRRHYDHRAHTGPSQCAIGADTVGAAPAGNIALNVGTLTAGNSTISSGSPTRRFNGRECGEHYDSGDHWLRQSGSPREPRQQHRQHRRLLVELVEHSSDNRDHRSDRSTSQTVRQIKADTQRRGASRQHCLERGHADGKQFNNLQ